MLLASAELDHVWGLDCMCDMMYDGRAFQTLNVIGESNREALRIDRQAAAGRNCHCSALISDGRVSAAGYPRRAPPPRVTVCSSQRSILRRFPTKLCPHSYPLRKDATYAYL